MPNPASQSTVRQKFVPLVVIGDASRREFSLVIDNLMARGDCRLTAAFGTIRDALANGVGRSVEADLILVLQSWSDEFASGDIDELIGRTLFHRLFCCYGTWCESIGRSHSQWPVALQLPARLATSIISRELDRVQNERLLPPTASAEEVFMVRTISGLRDGRTRERHISIAVLSGDRIVRQTVSAGCEALGFAAIPLHTLSDPPIRAVSDLLRRAEFVIQDVDDNPDSVRQSLRMARELLPHARLLGLTARPDAHDVGCWADLGVAAMIPRLDLAHGLAWHLSEAASTETPAVPAAAKSHAS